MFVNYLIWISLNLNFIFFRQLVQLAIDRHPAVKVRLEQLLHTLNTHLAAIEKHEKQVFQVFKDFFYF